MKNVSKRDVQNLILNEFLIFEKLSVLWGGVAKAQKQAQIQFAAKWAKCD